jgi:hypothetical protein
MMALGLEERIWSVQNLIERLHLSLAPEEQAWFQGGWRAFDGESACYNQAFNPNDIANHGKHVWGGQMLPDTIPIWGNGMGDCLNVRFKGDGSIFEFVEWHHEGGHWSHWGYSIQQVLCRNCQKFGRSEELLPDISSHGELSPVVIGEATCRLALKSRLHEVCRVKGGGWLAKLLGVDWSLFKTWLFDPALIPRDKAELLSASLGIGEDELIFQDWALALEQAESVLKLRNDLAWPYAVIGWAYERQRKIPSAKDAYRAGLMKLGSSASFTANWTRTNSTRANKFAAERLIALCDSGLDSQARDYIDSLTGGRTREYWLNQAERASARGDHGQAYQHFYAAGWDFFFSNDMGTILSSLMMAAEKAGLGTLVVLASMHRESLNS